MGVLAVPSVAHAAADTAKLTALNERDAAGHPVNYPIHQGETAPLTFGVVNRGTEPVDGVVLEAFVGRHLSLPKEFANCRYTSYGGAASLAWCEFDRTLAPGETYAVDSFHVTASADAAYPTLEPLRIRWYSKAWADAQGGFDAITKGDEPGGPGTVSLVAKQLPAPYENSWGDVGLDLIAPPDNLPLVPLGKLDAQGDPAVIRVPASEIGEWRPVVVGVVNTGSTTISKAVVHVEVRGGRGRLSSSPSKNCVSYENTSRWSGAWCEINEPILPNKTYAIEPLKLAGYASTEATSFTVTWHDPHWTDWSGGLETLARPSRGPGTAAGRGDGSGPDVHLVATSLPTPRDPKRSFVTTIELGEDDGSSSPSPSGSASPSPTTSMPAGDDGSGGEGGTGGGLPITGPSALSIGAIGGGLLLAGMLAIVLTRRRRAGSAA
ncbi:LPXTG cell wall anchor domain-containing protein [Paractinoplanes toevensis]|nr:LPXTG cell wall anchor domain-containing protein [Actinoplanes toevensis]